MDSIAADYVRLVLAAGRHDDKFVDAFYGPRSWQEAVDTAAPQPVAGLLERARDLLQAVRHTEPSERRRFLEAQLVAVETSLRRLGGETLPLDEEAKLTYDLAPPIHTLEEFREARTRLQELLPGAGDLQERLLAFREQFVIPPENLPEVVQLALAATRRRTLELAELPGDETFQVEYVNDRPWSAYHRYQGRHTSRIEVNVDLPIEIARILRTLAHEGYPGHHTYNVLLEIHLVENRGWPEFLVYPLFSPQSLLAEGSANAGMSVTFPAEEEQRLLEEVLAPLDQRFIRPFGQFAGLGVEELRNAVHTVDLAVPVTHLLHMGHEVREVGGMLEQLCYNSIAVRVTHLFHLVQETVVSPLLFGHAVFS